MTTTIRYAVAETHPGSEWAIVRVELDGSDIVSEQVMRRTRSQALALRMAESMNYAHRVAAAARARAGKEG